MESTNEPAKKKSGKTGKPGVPKAYDVTANFNGKQGKHSPYIPIEYDARVYEFALLGYSSKEIAELGFGVSFQAFRRWIKTYASFRNSWFAGNAIANSKVAAAFYKACVGYVADMEKPFVDKDGCEHVVKYKEYVGPDPQAALNWLKNREPNLWSDKTAIEHSGRMTVTMDLGGENGNVPDAIGREYSEFEEVDEENDLDDFEDEPDEE